MPPIEVRFYQEREGSVLLVDWLRSLPPKVQDKCLFAWSGWKRKAMI